MPYLVDLGILTDQVGIDFKINEDGLHVIMLACKYNNIGLIQLLLSAPSARIH